MLHDTGTCVTSSMLIRALFIYRQVYVGELTEEVVAYVFKHASWGRIYFPHGAYVFKRMLRGESKASLIN